MYHYVERLCRTFSGTNNSLGISKKTRTNRGESQTRVTEAPIFLLKHGMSLPSRVVPLAEIAYAMIIVY